MAKCTKAALIAWELGQTGYSDKGGKNKYTGKDEPWCAGFQKKGLEECGGVDMIKDIKYPLSCPSWRDFAKKKGIWHDKYKGLKRGDHVIFNFSTTKGRCQHIGLCLAFDGKNVTSIDGNTSSGNEANGGTVNKRIRNKVYIVGYIRLPYASGKVVTKAKTFVVPSPVISRKDNTYKQTLLVQREINWAIYRGFIEGPYLDEDGDWGKKTDSGFKRLQKWLKKKKLYTGKIDKSYGPKMETASKAAKKKYC